MVICMKINRNSACFTLYPIIVFILAFFLSSVKNHYFVLGKDYIAAETNSISTYFTAYIFEFWSAYCAEFFFALVPVILVNYLFVDILLNRGNLSKKIFNFFVLTIGITCLCEWGSFIVYQGKNLFQISSFSAFMLCTMLMECGIEIKLRGKLGVIFPCAVMIAVNMYYGICILSTSYSITNLIPLVTLVIAMYFIRFIKIALNKSTAKKGKSVLAILILALLGSILFLAWKDYSEHGAYQRDWRQLYYVAVYASFFLVYIMHYLPKAYGGSEVDTKRIERTSLILHCVLLNIIPGLCAFAVHGIILIISNGIILLVSYFLALYKNRERSNSWWNTTWLILFTYIYMTMDPIFYLNASKNISPIWPILKVSGSLISIATVVLPFILKPADDKTFTFISKNCKKLISGSTDIVSQTVVGGVGVLLLALFVIYYCTKIYADGIEDILSVAIIAPRLEGFGGLYLISWCVLPILLNVIFCFISLAYRAIQRKVRSEMSDT